MCAFNWAYGKYSSLCAVVHSSVCTGKLNFSIYSLMLFCRRGAFECLSIICTQQSANKCYSFGMLHISIEGAMLFIPLPCTCNGFIMGPTGPYSALWMWTELPPDKSARFLLPAIATKTEHCKHTDASGKIRNASVPVPCGWWL